jgi:hypothetical protein
MIKVFDDFERSYLGGKSIKETAFEFLDRSANPHAKQLRDEVNRLIYEYSLSCSSNELSRITGTLKSRDGGQFDEAFFELIVFSFLKKHNFNFNISEVYSSNKELKTPDFVVTGEYNNKFYIEATVLNEKIATYEIDSEILKKQIINRLEMLMNFGFHIFVETEANSLYYPESKLIYETVEKYLNDLKQWFYKLNREKERKIVESFNRDEPFMNSPFFIGYIGKDEFDLVKVIVKALAMSQEIYEKCKDSPLFITKGSFVETHNPGNIFRTCEKKARKYKDIPLYLAISVPSSIEFSKTSILIDLFGNNRLINNGKAVDLNVRSCNENSVFIDKQGKFRNNNLKGVIFFYRANSYPITPYETEIYFNPSVLNPAMDNLVADSFFIRKDMIMKYH